MSTWTRSLIPAAAFAAVGLALYANALDSPFIYDDIPAIVDNGDIRQLWPPDWMAPSTGPHAAVNSRPVVAFSLALNYAWGGLDPRSYRVFNLAIHILNALLLYGLVRRTLAAPAAAGLGLVCAGLWLVHPLASQCINYAIQRTELLMAFFYLLALYCAARDWRWGAVGACALGMASKEVMVSAPIIVLCYDRTFVAGSFAAAWRQRRWLYAGLAATWGELAALLRSTPHGSTVGPLWSAEAWNYALNQPGMVLRYLKLSLWPHPLILDYGFPQTLALGEVWWSAMLVVALVGLSVFAFFRWRGCGFLGICFFAVLAPTTSFLPLLNEVGAERRVYLALAALIVLAVVGGYWALRRWNAKAAVGVGLAAGAGLLLGYATVERNRDYQSERAIWRTVVERRPENPRGHNNLGKALYEAGALDSARVRYRRAVELKPFYPEAWGNLGLALYHLGDRDGAIRAYERALSQKIRSADTWYNLGVAHHHGGDLDRAVRAYRGALEIDSGDAEVWYNLGMAHKHVGAWALAIEAFAEVNRLAPDLADGWLETGKVRWHVGERELAVEAFTRVLALRPDDPIAKAALRDRR